MIINEIDNKKTYVYEKNLKVSGIGINDINL